MQSCLGIYIQDNLIKYAKVVKEKENIKVEAFGTKFYEDLKTAIDQIVDETNSTKLPISINISEEQYDYFEVFSLLNKQALKKSIDIEFELACEEKGIDKNSMEKRYMFVLNPENTEKMKAINVSVKKDILENEKELFEKYNLVSIQPLSTSITNLLKLNNNKTEIIVNMEEKTYLTFIRNGQIDQIEELETNIVEALEEITKRENSKNKAYEILKNITISAQEFTPLEEETEYMEDVVPVLFKMLNEIKTKIAEYGYPINKIYFTGTGVTINNVDMYFQDRLNDIECEILKPTFAEAQSLKIGIKDYIEVNSAISMALNGLGVGTTNELNFEAKENKMNIADFSVANIGKGKIPKISKIKSLKESSKEKLSPFEKLIIRLIALCAIFIICYSVISGQIMNSMNTRYASAEEKIKETTNSIEEMQNNTEAIDYLTKEYKSMTARLNNEDLDEEDAVFRERELPNFLTKIATTIPTEVRLVSLENTEDRHIVIQARSLKYQQLGYFKTILEVNNILKNVSSSTGVKYHDEEENQDYILITIEGDLV